MTERDAFIHCIAANLYDDTPRLAFADWLDEHGEHDRAEFIRVQCELEPMRDKYEMSRAAELHAREEHFGSRGAYLHDEARAWLGAMPEDWDDWDTGTSVEYRRGFPDTLALPARSFLEQGTKIRELHPTIRRVVLHSLNGWGDRIARCPLLEGLPELELACWYSDADARALAASPHLSELQVLELWLGRYKPLKDTQLCRIMAKGRAWPKLRELTLLNPDGEKATARQKLVTTANKAAGREIAVYQHGYPDLFPFAPGNRVGEPGQLPDGRLALAALTDTVPPAYEVITFDADGNQSKEVITVPLPPELAALRDEAYLHKDRYHQFIRNAVGMTSTFIRIRSYSFPSHPHDRVKRGHEHEWEELLGHPDDPGGNTEYPYGFGGQIYGLMRRGEFVVANGDWWCDKRGHVHST